MKLSGSTIAAILLLSTTAFSQTSHSRTQKQNAMEPTVIANSILKNLENGWNNANGTLFAQAFANTSEFIDIRGTLHQNATRQYLAEAHQGVFMGIYKDSKVLYNLVQAILIDENTILANAKAELDAPSGPLAGRSASTISLVLVKSGNTWEIRAFHNTLVIKK